MNTETKNEIIDKAEQAGREAFTKVCNQEKWCKVNKFAKDRGARYDVSYTNNSLQVVGEVKGRRYNSDTFNEWYFQKDKYDALNQLAKEAQERTGKPTKIAYINSYQDNILSIWEIEIDGLNNVKPVSRLMQVNDWSSKEEYKDVFLMHRVKANKFEIDLTKSIFKV